MFYQAKRSRRLAICRGTPMLLCTLLLATACSSGSAKAGLGPNENLAPSIVSLELEVAQRAHGTDEVAVIRAKGRLASGGLVVSGADWMAPDGGQLTTTADGAIALFFAPDTGKYRVIGRGRGKGNGNGNGGGGTGGEGGTSTEPADTVEVVVEQPSSPIVSISTSPSAVQLGVYSTTTILVNATRQDGSQATPIANWSLAGPGSLQSLNGGANYSSSQQVGSATVTASLASDPSISAPTAITIVPDPAPAPGDRVLYDLRSSLQQMGTSASALSALTYASSRVGFTSDFDGNGTHAYRIDWPNWNGVCEDHSEQMQIPLTAPYPQRLFVQWKAWQGRTATGGGIGDLGRFQLTNGNCGNAGRKLLLVMRDVPDRGNDGRFSYVLAGPAPAKPLLHAGGTEDPHYGSGFDFQAHVNQVVTTTVFVQASSSYDATDGIIQMWVNGTKVVDVRNAKMRDMSFHRLALPTTFRAPQYDQSEYIWGIVAWEPSQ